MLLLAAQAFMIGFFATLIVGLAAYTLVELFKGH